MPSSELAAYVRLQGDPSLVVDRQGTVVLGNRAAAELLGVASERLVGSPLGPRVSGGPAQLQRMLQRCARTREPVVGALTLNNAAGQVVHFPFRGIQLQREGGRAVLFALQYETGAKFRALTGDIARTQVEVRRRRQRERAARESEARLAAIWNSIGDGAIATDAAGLVVRMNPVAQALTGWPEAEAVGRPLAQVFEIVNADSGLRVDNPVDEVLSSGKTVDLANHTVLIARDGSRRHIADSGAPIIEGGSSISGVVLVFRDVTEAYSARARLLRHSTAMEQAADAIVLTDTHGLIEYVNPAFERVTGFEGAQLQGQTIDILRSGEHDAAFYNTLWSTIAAGQVWSGRIINKRADGSLYTSNASIAPVRGPAGEVDGYVSVQQDISQQLQLEQELRQAQRMEAVGLLAGGVAHDFNNLLTVIQACCEFIGEKVGPTDPIYRDLSDIITASDRAQALTRQLLIFSSHQVTQRERVDLNQLVQNLSQMLGRLIGEDIVFSEVLVPELSCIEVEPGQVEQVIVNLVVNARDAMPTGGSLSLRTCELEVSAQQAAQHIDLHPGRFVTLTVEDDGAGMSPEVLSKAFDPFFTTKGPGRGTGLGLSTVLGIVQQSDGCVLVDSTPGLGTRFTLYFPAVAGEPQPVAEPKALEVAPNSETILVVEDEEMVRRIAVEALEQAGYHVLQARSGTEAMAMSSLAAEVDLLLCDVVMPGHRGPKVAAALREVNPQLQVLFMSGYPGGHLGEQGELETFPHLLQKPFSLRQLVEAVRALIDAQPEGA